MSKQKSLFVAAAVAERKAAETTCLFNNHDRITIEPGAGGFILQQTAERRGGHKGAVVGVPDLDHLCCFLRRLYGDEPA